MTNNADSLNKEVQMSYYRNRALSMMGVYESEEVEKLYVWLNRFEYVANIICIPRDKMIEFFLNMVNDNVRERVQQIINDVDFYELPYESIITHYLLFFSSEKDNINRKRFMCRNQYEQEPIKHYANCLRRMINKCNYESETDEKLCAKFLDGLREIVIRNHLRETNYESFDEMVTNAIEFAKINLITYYVDRALLKIDIYNPLKQGFFYVWLNKFEYVADMLKVPYNKMVKFFNKMMDIDVYMFVQKTFPSVNFFELPYEVIAIHYLHYFSPFEIDLHRPRIWCRKQYEEETIESYAHCLQEICSRCVYTNDLGDKLFKQFNYGLRENKIRIHLCKFNYKSFDEIVRSAIEFAKVHLITYYQEQALLKIDIYNPEREDEFQIWLNKFEHVATMIEVPANKMIELFNKMVDNDVHRTVKRTYPSINFTKLPYELIIEYYFLRFSLPHEMDLNKKRFMSRIQYEEESLRQYAISFKKLYYKCYYISGLDKKLVLRFIEGIRDKDLKNHLIQMSILSFDQMLLRAFEFESRKKYYGVAYNRY